nr:hypothetical protein [Desulfobulbaceae bacterium]
MEDLSQDQPTRNRYILIIISSLLSLLLLIVPPRNYGFIEPEGQASLLHQSRIILFPVEDSILRLICCLGA